MPNTDQTNFWLLLSFTSTPELKQTGSGGSATNVNCFDCILTSDNAGTTLLSQWESDTYNGTTGVWNVWATRTLLTATDTKLYLFIGNASTTTFQGGTVSSVWSFLRRVYHLGDGTTLSLTSSSSAGESGALTNHSAIAAAGQISGGVATSSTPHYLSGNDITNNLGGTGVVVGAWIKTSSAANSMIFNWGIADATNQVYLYMNSSGKPLIGKGGSQANCVGTTTINDGAWHNFTAVYGGGTSTTIYVDGAADTTCTLTLAPAALAGSSLGAAQDTSQGFTGSIDEVHVGYGTLTADWIATEFNNQSNPGTFETISAAVDPVTSGVKHRVIM